MNNGTIPRSEEEVERAMFNALNYMPPDDFVDQSELEKNSGTSSNFWSCINCQKVTADKHLEDKNGKTVACSRPCCRCKITSHRGARGCPRLYLSAKGCKDRYGTLPTRAQVDEHDLRFRPSHAEAQILVKRVCPLFKVFFDDNTNPKKRELDGEVVPPAKRMKMEDPDVVAQEDRALEEKAAKHDELAQNLRSRKKASRREPTAPKARAAVPPAVPQAPLPTEKPAEEPVKKPNNEVVDLYGHRETGQGYEEEGNDWGKRT
jgi:hypothetical protein